MLCWFDFPPPFFVLRSSATPVYLVLGYHYEHIGLLVSLRRRGLLAQGDYFVVGIDIEQYDAALPTKYMHGLLQTTPDPDVVEAFRHYLAVVPSAPVRFDEFAVKVSIPSTFIASLCVVVGYKFTTGSGTG